MSSTIDYYNQNAEQYYKATVSIDFKRLRTKFAACIPDGGTIVDMGCGSGRDVKAFSEMGYQTIGLDASPAMAKLAEDNLGIKVIVDDMATWRAEAPVDGIWCCASLLHLTEQETASFFSNLSHNLKPQGSIFLSVKEGIKTGYDEDGRFTKNYTKKELEDHLRESDCEIVFCESGEDALGRQGFTWLSVIAQRRCFSK